MLGIERFLTFLLCPCDAIALSKISHLLCLTSLDASVCLVICVACLPNRLQRRRRRVSVVSFSIIWLIELIAWIKAVIPHYTIHAQLSKVSRNFESLLDFRTQDYATSRTLVQAGFSHPRNILAYLRI